MAKSKKVISSRIKDKDNAGFSYCSLVKTQPREFSPEINRFRMEAIVLVQNKWVNGTVLKYYIFKGGSDGSPTTWKGSTQQMDVVRKAFKVWQDLGIGLEFVETSDRNESQVRIGFKKGDGSWSYVGRDVIDLVTSPNERTMNFGWDISNDIDTVLHEIGHTLGMPHEHQNPFAGIVWNEAKVYEALAKSPNFWSKDKTYHNIIRKLPVGEVEGSSHDANSIMHYPFEAGLINEPIQFRNGIRPAGGLSSKDIEYVKKFYPALKANDYIQLKLSLSQSMNIKAGEQKNFTFTPKLSRKYTIETFGKADTLMVLFEKIDNEEIYLSGDDDSGKDYNSKIIMRLIKGRKYIIRVRLYYAESTDSVSLMVF